MRLALAVLLLMTAMASAQVVAPYTENFDSGLPAGWTISNSSAEGVGWAVDGDPGIVRIGNGLGGSGVDGPTAGGSAGSLNYNDGINYEEDIAKGANKGTATSPVIDVSALGGSVMVSFDLNMETDFYLTQDPFLDYFTMTITDEFGNSNVYDFGDNTAVPPLFFYTLHSGPMGTFRRVGFEVISAGTLDPTTTTIQLDFRFACDGANDAYNGIFIDNLQVCSDSLVPSTPSNLLPLDGSIVAGGVGVPVNLDWTDSVDSTDCGTGAIWVYLVEVLDAASLSVYSNTTDDSRDTILAGLPPGTYHWHVLAVDGAFLLSPLSADTFFTIEAALPPDAPDSLFVNESPDGAQSGDAGFVDPVVDQTPAFSALYRDPNTVDSAIGLRFQVTDDLTFATLLFDSGTVGISPPLPKDARCPDLTINVSLQRDTVHYWRIQFTDASGFTGPFSVPQSFRIGDDFEFGVRHGSTHHGHRCYVATAAFGGVTPEVASIAGVREGLLETLAPGRIFSRWYATAGAPLSTAAAAQAPLVRGFLRPAGAAASSPLAGLAVALLILGIVTAGVRRS